MDLMQRRFPVHFSAFIALLMSIGCGAGSATRAQASPSPASTSVRADEAPRSQSGEGLVLIAALPMNEGFGPAQHDEYEARIAPIAREHGMAREIAYSVNHFVAGTGPRQASTIGIWSLASMGTVQAVMSDARYGEQVAYRDRIHDMANAAMYLAREEFVGAAPAPGHVLLVGLVAMNPGSGFEEHQVYESTLAPITARHGMRLYRSYRVIQTLSGVANNNIAAINLWEMPSPDALGQVMNDPDYVAHVPYRNRIHDMAATTMHFVTSRGEVQ